MGIRYNKALGKNFRPDGVPVVFLYCFSPFLWRLSRRSILGFVPGGLSEGEAQSKCLEALSDNSDTMMGESLLKFIQGRKGRPK